APLEDVLLVHTEDYVSRLRGGELTAKEVRRLGLPWSESLVRRSFYAVGGTLAAAAASLADGYSSNLAGGTHHSFPDHGEGFCVLNDVAIAIRALRARKSIERAAIVDLDVHQGNGTATIFAGDADTFTFSMHGANNYPLFKTRSTLDVELPDGTSDAAYMETLGSHLPHVFQSDPDIVFYLAGADPYRGDKLGRLALSIDGLRERDAYVLRECYEREIPIVTVMSGGYGKDINDTIEIHCNTIRMVKEIFELRVATRRLA
ncbi:MAG TPA: histone deacetylase, partial [Pyrinomonadaceae bacterium]|nr:histone deacetylase [Pyrinomonadaceae bacterium]